MVTKPRSAEMHPGSGFRVRTDFPRLDPALMAQFRHFATPDISDLLNRLYAVDPAVQCLTGDFHQLCGPACTVKVFPGDNLMVHKSLDVAKPGNVVVVDAGRSTMNAVLGDLVSSKAKHLGIAGFIVDGLIRDLPGILEIDYPVFARGTTPVGPLHRGPGEVNFPICCGGVVVNPGDLIVADAAGVVVVPRGDRRGVAGTPQGPRGDQRRLPGRGQARRILQPVGGPDVGGTRLSDPARPAAGGGGPHRRAPAGGVNERGCPAGLDGKLHGGSPALAPESAARVRAARPHDCGGREATPRCHHYHHKDDHYPVAVPVLRRLMSEQPRNRVEGAYRI